jgi:hypothetical protein
MQNTCGERTMGPAHRDPLPLPAGEGLGFAVQERLQVEDLRGLADPFGALVLGHLGHLQREAHVLRDGHVRVEGVGLEHHGDVPIPGGQAGDVAVADADGALVDVFQPGEHPQ